MAKINKYNQTDCSDTEWLTSLVILAPAHPGYPGIPTWFHYNGHSSGKLQLAIPFLSPLVPERISRVSDRFFTGWMPIVSMHSPLTNGLASSFLHPPMDTWWNKALLTLCWLSDTSTKVCTKRQSASRVIRLTVMKLNDSISPVNSVPAKLVYPGIRAMKWVCRTAALAYLANSTD